MTDLQTTQPAAVATRPSNVRDALARSLNIDPDQLVAVVKSQCFKGDPRSITNEQLTAFLSVAADLGVNPLLPGMLYAYPLQGGGIVPMIGPDGVYTMLARREEYGGHRYEYEYDGRTLVAVTCIISWRGRDLPVSKRIVVAEWEMPKNPNWETRRTHMAETRALKQAARQVIHGLPWDEEERRIAQAIEVPHTVVTTSPARGTAALAAKLIDDRPVEPAPLPQVPAEPEPQADPAPTSEDVAAMARRLFNRCANLKGDTAPDLFAYIVEEAGGKPGATVDSFAAIKAKHAAAAMDLLNRAAVVLSDVG